MLPKYLFITGLGRSGTKLIQNVLRLSPGLRLVSAGETKYMGSLLKPGFCVKIRDEVARGAPDGLERIADLCIEESPCRDVWNDLKEGRISRERLIDELKNVEFSEKGVYECVLALRAESAEGDQLLVDKTPQNLYHVGTLMTWFPYAKAIHMIRDPRAVLASEWTRRMQEYPERVYLSVRFPRSLYSVMIVFHVSLTWRYAVHLDRRYHARYPNNYVLVRFEDVVSQPESTIRYVTGKLDVAYDTAMVVPPSKGSSFVPENESGMDQNTLNRWEAVLKPWMILIVKVICGRSMRKVGYR